MSGINSVRNLQILYFSQKNKEIRKLKKDEKKWPQYCIFLYYFNQVFSVINDPKYWWFCPSILQGPKL